LYLSKIITTYFICFLIYKIIKENLLNKTKSSFLKININNYKLNSKKKYKKHKKNIKKQSKTINNEGKNDIDDDINDSKNEDKNDYQLVLYKHKKKSNYNIKDIYNNFFHKKPHTINTDIDINLFNLSKNNNNQTKIEKDTIILSDNKDNILLLEDKNFIVYDFMCKKENIYKIKVKLFTNDADNIKLIISNENKRFVYDYNENNTLNDTKIKEYGFILDNYFQVDSKIYIYLLFYNNLLSNIIIDHFFIEIIEKSYVKEESIIIFDVNNKYIPLYPNTKNILDYKEFIDNSNIFFI
jgi:hypothetical protein